MSSLNQSSSGSHMFDFYCWSLCCFFSHDFLCGTLLGDSLRSWASTLLDYSLMVINVYWRQDKRISEYNRIIVSVNSLSETASSHRLGNEDLAGRTSPTSHNKSPPLRLVLSMDYLQHQDA